MMKILCNFATRGRPQRFKEALDSIICNTIHPENMLIFVKLDSDDTFLKQYEDLIESYLEKGQNNISYTVGISKNKIDAINRDIDTVEKVFDFNFDIIVNMSDDMLFTYKGYDDVIRNIFEKYFPDTDICPCFKDKYRNDGLITLAVMGRKYYQRFGYIYHPDYVSLYCDNEQTLVAGILKRYTLITTPIIFIHEHCNNNPLIVKDERYQITEGYYKQDAETFKKRKARNFDLK